MASATFTLTDDAGQVRLDVNFVGGFDAKSPAHVAGQVLISHMDKLQADEVAASQCAHPKTISISDPRGSFKCLVCGGVFSNTDRSKVFKADVKKATTSSLYGKLGKLDLNGTIGVQG